jgi:hypothetical protein
LMEEKCSGSFGLSKKLKISSKIFSSFFVGVTYLKTVLSSVRFSIVRQ